MKLEFNGPRNINLKNFINDVKSSVVQINNNDCDELIITKEDDVPFLVMMKYGKLRTLVEQAVRQQLREIDSVVTRSIRHIDTTNLSTAQQNLLKIRSKLDCFDNMSEEDVMNVTDNVQFLQCSANEKVFDQGETGNKIYYIAKGSVKIFAYNEDEQSNFRLIANLPGGTVLGEMSPITGETRSARALTGVDGTILLSFEFTQELNEENEKAMFQLYRNFVKLISKKLIDANNKMTSRK